MHGSLMLTRRIGEVICIDPFGLDIRVQVVEIRGDRVRLLVMAPRSVTVHRLEVVEAIQQQEAS